jgi:hypothetical protein
MHIPHLTSHVLRPTSHVLRLTSLVLLLTSCHTLKIEKPAESYNPAVYAPGYSYLNIPFATDARTLEQLINREYNGMIYADTSFDNNNKDNLMVKAWKRDSIKIRIEKNMVYYRVPLMVWVKKRFQLAFLNSVQETTVSLALKFKTRVTLNKDWTISTMTFADGYDWINAPEIDLGVVKLPVSFIGDLLMGSNQQDISKEIDKAFHESVDLKKIMRDAWIGMQKPVELSHDYNLWMKVTPSEISSVPVQGNSTLFNHTIGIRARIETFMGQMPDTTVIRELPALKITSSIPEQFNLSCSVDFPYSYIRDLSMKEMKGYELNYKNYHITIEDIFFYGQGDRLIIALPVDGSIKGTVYLAGTPVFDHDSLAIRFDNLDFDFKTKNVLVKSASWMFHSGLLQTLRSRLSFPVGDRLGEVKSEIRSFLEKNPSFGIFRISGSLSRFDLDKILIAKESVKAYFVFEGRLRVSLSPASSAGY